MDLLIKKLNKLKVDFTKQQKESKRIKETTTQTLKKFFPNFNFSNLEINYNKNKIVIKTPNKTIANELFFKKEEIQKEINLGLKGKYQLIVF